MNNKSPGTVSKILWHFTGGPTWDSREKKQGKNPKTSAEAYEALKSILNSRQLRIGNYKEVAKVEVKRFVRQRVRGEKRKFKLKTVVLESCPVCCLADIPLRHLEYHADRYGKFALGFYRNSVVKNGFNPVLYTLENSDLIKSIYSTLNHIQQCDASDIDDYLDDIKREIQIVDDEQELNIEREFEYANMAVDSIKSDLDYIRDEFEEILAFIKTFSKREFSTIYCEREWRSIEAFDFSNSDLAMIVLPKKSDGIDYYQDFLENQIDSIDIPKRIPIVPWEDTIEQ